MQFTFKLSDKMLGIQLNFKLLSDKLLGMQFNLKLSEQLFVNVHVRDPWLTLINIDSLRRFAGTISTSGRSIYSVTFLSHS